MKSLNHLTVCFLTAIFLLPLVMPFEFHATAQSGLYIPSEKPIKNMEKALHHPERFCLLLNYNGKEANYSIADLDLLDSAYRIAFDVENPMYYTMTIEGYGTSDEQLTKERVDAIYRYFAMRGSGGVPIRYARNPIHCSCKGDTSEILRFEVPTAISVYNTDQLPASRTLLNKTIDLHNSVLIHFTNNPDECVGQARGCFVPSADSIVHGYYASLMLARGSVYAVEGTKDTCPGGFSVSIDDHLDYRSIVEQYRLIPHRKNIIVSAGYIVLSSTWQYASDSCTEAQKDSIFIRIPATKEQVEAKLKFFAKVTTARGVEYRQLPTRKSPGKGELMLQAPINITQFDTIFLGKRIPATELKKYFYPVAGPTEAAAFRVANRFYVAYRTDKNGNYELKRPLRELFRITPNQEEESPTSQPRKKESKISPDEIID